MGLPGKLRHPTENIQGQGSAPHIALHLPSNMGTRGGCLLGEARNQDVYPRDPQHGPTASLPGAAIIHSHLHTCIHSSSGRLPALCQEFPIKPIAQQQGPETAGLSKRTIAKDTSVGRMKWELGPTGYKESARGAEV